MYDEQFLILLLSLRDLEIVTSLAKDCILQAALIK